ncbi:MAG: UDP-N-acetylmuramoyl-tripeptide--D-alanyl-D-alanine ligase [Sphingomonadaceae bacterium]|nr:UDP-N-acetylmuramoyl-tripeptide--D-alanyl-D-alanine ligase [Sphingomonadaceae bacterium]
MNAQVRVLEWPAASEGEASTALWDAISIARAVKGTANADFRLAGVEIDSRDVVPGDLFFALKGESMDGHRFVEMALEKGAAAVIVDRACDGPHVRVNDTTDALRKLGAAARERSRARIVGVTGSAGKTGVKEAIFAALDRSSRGRAHRSVKSYNNHVGVPLSLARMPERSRYGIFEMGMNHAGEIAALTAQVRPHVAVITTIAPAHIEMLGSEEAIADAKAEIFEGVEEDGTAIIPADSPHFERLRDAAMRRGLRVIAFGKAPHANVRLIDAVDAPGGGSLITAEMGDRRICYTVAMPGEHWAANSLAVMAAVRAVGGDLGAAGLSLAEMAGMAGRGERLDIEVEGGNALLIDESYNANPASMSATLAQLGTHGAGRRVAVLGAMKELGSHAPAFHAALSAPLRDAGVDLAILVGDEMDALARELGKPAENPVGNAVPFAHCETVEQAMDSLREFGLKNGDAVLVKGSNSIGLDALVSAFSSKEG